jgi:hypothetical protein
MSDDTKTITGTITRADGSPVSGARVYFTLSNGEALVSYGATVVRAPVSVVANSSGVFSATLKRNDAAFSDTHYSVLVEYNHLGQKLKEEFGKIQILDDAIDDLDVLLARDLVVGRGVDTVVLAAALEAVGARDGAVDAAAGVEVEAILDLARDETAKQLPLAPNMLKDTRYFSGLCGGALGQVMSVDAVGAVSAPWDFRLLGGVSATVKIIHPDDFDAEGLPEARGSLADVLGDDPERVDFHVVVFDVSVPDVADANFDFRQTIQASPPCLNFGQGVMQHGVHAIVLEQSGETVFRSGHNIALKDIGASALGEGWVYHRMTTRGGFRYGSIRNYFFGAGTMKIAIALPYSSTGDHRGRAVWAGYAPAYAFADAVE